MTAVSSYLHCRGCQCRRWSGLVPHCKARRQESGLSNDKAVLNIQNWLEKNFNEISVGRLADKSGMTRKTFERRFKHATGDSPLRYIQRVKIENVKQLLEKGGKTFDEITYMMRYEGSSTFLGIFKKTTGAFTHFIQKKYSFTAWKDAAEIPIGER